MSDEDSDPLRPEDLFRTHAAYVTLLATRLLGRVADVDDLVQDVFIRAFKSLDQVRHPEAVRAWLAAITFRVGCDRLSGQRARRRVELDGAPEEARVAFSGPNGEEVALLSQVWNMLDGLPGDLRTPWLLRYAEEEAIDEIARRCGCSPATAKRRIERAHGALRRRFSDSREHGGS